MISSKEVCNYINDRHKKKYGHILLYYNVKTFSILKKDFVSYFNEIGLLDSDIFEYIDYMYEKQGSRYKMMLRYLLSKTNILDWINRPVKSLNNKYNVL